MLLLKVGVRQVYEIILLLADLSYLVIWRDNLKLSQSPNKSLSWCRRATIKDTFH